MTRTDQPYVYVEADARLHLGVLDLRGSRGRWFGGIGAASSALSVLVSARAAGSLAVTGEDAARAAEFASRFLTYQKWEGGVSLHVHRALPPHSGLGSGTQLALAVAQAICAVRDETCEIAELARSVGRASRSAIGTWTFAGGGLVVEGGRRPGHSDIAPLLARLPIPESWRCVLVVPSAQAGLNGAAEHAAFAQLPPPSEEDVHRVAHLVLMGLLPALADSDLASFGTAVTELQQVTGRWFAPIQGGSFAAGPSTDIIRRMVEWGVPGVGQSSWGPAVYGIVDGDPAASRLAERVRGIADPTTSVHVGKFSSEGARVWRANELMTSPPSTQSN